jgi:XTP/dITP diphosphohydrolase
MGYQMAFCQRDTAIHLALLATALVFAAVPRRPRPLSWKWYAILVVPIAIDGGTALIGLRDSTPFWRTLTGALFGMATALLVLPYLDLGFGELGADLRRVRSTPYRLLLGTHNPGKAAELAQTLSTLAQRSGIRLELVMPHDLDIAPMPESGSTFEEISAAKARAYFAAGGLPTLADDGGLEIAAFDGAPGVKSRRWLGDGAGEDELIAYTLDRMSELDGESRAAQLRTCLSFVDGAIFDQECAAIEGTIASHPSEQRTVGYPYRSLFLVAGTGRYYDELSDEEHELLNHRRRAATVLFERAILPAVTRMTEPPAP